MKIGMRVRVYEVSHNVEYICTVDMFDYYEFLRDPDNFI